MSASGSATIDYEYRRGPGRGGWKGVMFDLSSTVMSRIKEGFFGQIRSGLPQFNKTIIRKAECLNGLDRIFLYSG